MTTRPHRRHPRPAPLAATVSLLGLLAVVVAAPTARAQDVGLRFIGQQIFPTGFQANGTTVGGLSGIDYDASSGTYYAISDSRSETATGVARFYNISLNFDADSFSSVTFNSSTQLLRPDGATFPALTVDPESIRVRPSAIAGGAPTLVWTSEGENRPDLNRVAPPFVREMTAVAAGPVPAGSFVRELTTPARYSPVASPATSGIRNNLAFESLVVQPGANRVLTATENALLQDGPAAGVGVGSASRILTYNLTTGVAEAEFVYRVEPVAEAPTPEGSFATNGLVEFLTLDAGNNRFLAVERSFSTGAPGTGNTIRIYQFDLAGATDVSALETLTNGGFTAVSKTLVLDLTTLGIPLDNVEGITFGPTLANGNRSLVLVSDNNFNSVLGTQFLTFEVTAVPEPGTSALLLGAGAAGGLVAWRRRRRLQLRGGAVNAAA